MTITTEKIKLVYVEVESTAYNFGFEDARDGEDARGSLYFPIESVQWKAYNAGYVAGWRGDPMVVAWMLEGQPGLPEGAFCDVDASDIMPWEYREDYVGC